MCPPFSDPDQRLYVRNATLADIPGIIRAARCMASFVVSSPSRQEPRFAL